MVEWIDMGRAEVVDEDDKRLVGVGREGRLGYVACAWGVVGDVTCDGGADRSAEVACECEVVFCCSERSGVFGTVRIAGGRIAPGVAGASE